MPAAERRRWTAAEVRQLNADTPGHWPRYELIDGELLVAPAPRPRHQIAAAWLFERLSPYVNEQKLGRALWSPSDLELAPEEITQPDVSVIPFLRGPQAWGDVQRLVLAVEVLSPSTARNDRTVKRRFCQRVGVPEYWIVDLDAQLVNGGVRATSVRRSSRVNSSGEPMVLRSRFSCRSTSSGQRSHDPAERTSTGRVSLLTILCDAPTSGR